MRNKYTSFVRIPLSAVHVFMCFCLPGLRVSVDEEISLLAGTLGSLSCSLGSPLLSDNFAWMKNGSIVNTSISRITVNSTANTSTLQFNPLRTSDGGQYQCVATVMIGGNSVNLTDEIDLNVTGKDNKQPMYMYGVLIHVYL